jgi:hypothetical protein
MLQLAVTGSQLDLRRHIVMGVHLCGMVNASLACVAPSIAEKTEFADGCLYLASMMHDHAPVDDTIWLLNYAQGLVGWVAKRRDSEKKEEQREETAMDGKTIRTIRLKTPIEIVTDVVSLSLVLQTLSTPAPGQLL